MMIRTAENHEIAAKTMKNDRSASQSDEGNQNHTLVKAFIGPVVRSNVSDDTLDHTTFFHPLFDHIF
ncbi:hypothetical protein AVEN_188088-1, partial [Araneus ventricosus]